MSTSFSNRFFVIYPKMMKGLQEKFNIIDAIPSVKALIVDEGESERPLRSSWLAVKTRMGEGFCFPAVMGDIARMPFSYPNARVIVKFARYPEDEDIDRVEDTYKIRRKETPLTAEGGVTKKILFDIIDTGVFLPDLIQRLSQLRGVEWVCEDGFMAIKR